MAILVIRKAQPSVTIIPRTFLADVTNSKTNKMAVKVASKVMASAYSVARAGLALTRVFLIDRTRSN